MPDPQTGHLTAGASLARELTAGARLLFLNVEAGDFTYDGQGDLRLPRDTPAHFQRLFDALEVDGSSCASCEDPVGYVLDDDDDGRPTGHWRWTTLVWDEGRRIGWALCEDCAWALDPMVSRLLADDRELPRTDAQLDAELESPAPRVPSFAEAVADAQRRAAESMLGYAFLEPNSLYGHLAPFPIYSAKLAAELDASIAAREGAG